MKKWLFNIQHWSDYIYGYEELNKEFSAVQSDLDESGNTLNEDEYITDGMDLSIVFKSLRLRLLYFNDRGMEMTTLSNVLSAYGYGIASPFIMSYICRCMDFYRIKAFDEVGNECDIRTLNRDDSIQS